MNRRFTILGALGLLFLVAILAVALVPHFVARSPQAKSHARANGPVGVGWQNYDLIVSPGDWDQTANGAPDIIARRSSDGTLWLFSGDGTGGYGVPARIASGWGIYTKLVGIAGFRGHNSPPDLLAVRGDGHLILFPNLGHGVVGIPVSLGPGWGAFDTILASNNFGGDHLPDLIARNGADGSLMVFRGTGLGGFSGHSRLTPVSFSQYSLLAAPGDWDNDGYPDLLARSLGGNLCLFRGNGRGGLLNTSCLVVGRGWGAFDEIVTPGTWDQDNSVDLLARTHDGSLLLASGAGISGYSDPISVQQCSSVALHISSAAPDYTINFQRYGDASPKTVATLRYSNGDIQSIASDASRTGANWAVSATYTDTCSWKSGLYAAQFATTAQVGSSGASVDYTSYATFVVRAMLPPPKRQLLVVASTNTWAAYNDWPQRGSFYAKGRPTEVSYLRPNPGASPLRLGSHLAGGELEVLQWLAQNNFSYQMVSDVDLNDDPSIVSTGSYYAVLLNTHSEYWTDPMYDTLAKFLQNGGSVLSLSGNTMYREETLKRQPGVGWSTLLVGGTQRYRTPYAVANLLGLQFDETGDTCASYHVVLPRSWLMAGISARNVGARGRYWPSGCFLNARGVGAGASGNENDVPPPFLLNRKYLVVANGNNVDAASHIVWYLRRDGGQSVSVGSITFGNSLVVDGNLSRMVKNVLVRFERFHDAGQTTFGGLIAPGDWNGDGHPDILARRGDALFLYRGDGHGGLIGPQFISSGWARLNLVSSAGNWTRHSRPDVLARRASDGALFAYPNDGSGGLIRPFRLGSRINWSQYDTITGVGDWNGDTIPDLIARTPNGSMYLFEGSRGGQVKSAPQMLATGWDQFDQVIGPVDWNRDGLPDLIARKPDGSMWIALGRRDHTLATPEQMPDTTTWDEYSTILGGGDWNGDGHPDLVARRGDGVLVMIAGSGEKAFHGSAQMSGSWNGFS